MNSVDRSETDAGLGDAESQDDLEARRLLARVRENLAGVASAPVEIGRYALKDKIGTGAAGVVYAAHDPELDRRIAIKLLEVSDETLAARFLREARALAELSHPNVVQVYDAGRAGSRVWIAMELVEGETLGRWLASSKRSEAEIVRVFAEAGRGLAAAHARGIVHRDFKPANVLMGDDGRPRVVDFGLAREVATDGDPATTLSEGVPIPATADSLTRTGTVLGTPAYMAPEQACGEPIDARADQFSFCVALFEALVGRRPFEGETLHAIIDAAQRGLGRDDQRRLGPRVRAAVVRGLAAEPADRHPDMDTLLRSLHAGGHAMASWVLLGAGVTLAVGGVLTLSADEDVSTCRAAGEELVARWNDRDRAAIEAAFEATGASFATGAWTRIEPELDRHVQGWSDNRGQVCELDPETPHLDATQWCMQGRRRALVAVLDRLSEADARAVGTAIETVANLEDAEPCLDPEVVAQEEPPPPEELRPAVDAVLQRLASGRAATNIGRDDLALAEYDAAAAAAEELGYGPLLAEALADQGRARAQEQEGVEILERAHALAIEHDRHGSALRAALGLVWALGVRQQRPDDAESWVRHAQASLERRGHPPDEEALYVNAVAALLSVRGAYDEAIAQYETLIEMRAVEDAAGVRLATAKLHLGRALLYAGHNDEARAELEDALQTAVAAVGESHPNVGMVWQALGGVAYGQQRLDDAEEAFESAAAIHETFEAWDHLANDIGGLASVAQVRLRNDEAIALHRRSIELQERAHGPDHPNVARQLDNYSTALQAAGRFDDAEEPLRRSLEIKRATLGPDHRSLGMTHSHLGSLAEMRGKSELAEQEYARAVEILEAAAGPEHSLTAIALTGLARARLGQAKYQRAKNPAERAVAIFEKTGAFPSQIADAESTLAGVLVGPEQGACKGSDRPVCTRARSLANDARERYVTLGPALQPQVDALDAWMPEHL